MTNILTRSWFLNCRRFLRGVAATIVLACLAAADGEDRTGARMNQVTSLLVTYPVAPGVQKSWSYKVSVNGEPVFVERWQDISYVHFAFAGKAEVKVRVIHSLHATQSVKMYRLSPVSYDIASKVNDRDISFTLDRPRKLVLWRVDGVPEKLLIFADPLEDDAPRLGDPGVVNVLNYGVDSAGRSDSTARIQRAMDETAAKKGVLYFPPGQYLAGDLSIKSHLTCYLSGGAMITCDPPRDRAWKTIAFDSMAESAKLFGRGTLSKYHIRGYANKNIRIEGIILRSGPAWSVMLKAADYVTIDNFKLIGCYELGGSDGIDPDLARHWVIEDTFILAGDDAIAVKTLDETTVKDLARNSKDMKISGCVFFATACGFQFGSETESDSIKDMTFENTDCISTASPISQWPAHPCSIENIWYRNIRVEEVPRGHIPHLVHFVIAKPNRRTRGAVNPFGPGRIKKVVIQSLRSEESGPGGSVVVGWDKTHPVENVTFDNLRIAGKLITNAEGARIKTNEFVNDLRFTSSDEKIVGVHASGLYATGDRAGAFAVTRTGDLSHPLTVTYRVRGTAKSGGDYVALPGSVIIPSGASSVAIAVAPTAPGCRGGLKTVLLQLTNKHGWESPYMLGSNFQAVVNIAGEPE
jgi:hypothetical protein